MEDPKKYHFILPKEGRPKDAFIPEAWYPGIQAFWGKSTNSRIFDPIFGIRAIIIHATAGSSSAGAVSVMRMGKVSFHWLVPDENEPQHGKIVWACAPEARAAKHVRDDKRHPDINKNANMVNRWSLGIEVVNTQVGDPFSDWQVQVTAQIVRYCWAKYPNLVDVTSHAKLDPERRTDPGPLFPWERFKQLVLQDNGQDGVPEVAALATDAALVKSLEALHLCCLG